MTELAKQAVERNASNVHQIDLVESFQPDKAIQLVNGEVLTDVDVVVFSTGYLFSFPFLPNEKDDLIKTGQKVHQLDHYMFYRKNPTLCFIGLPIRVTPMPLMQRQSTAMARYWSGKIPMVPHEYTSSKAESSDSEDNRLDFVMGIAREYDYNEKIGAWSEGWTKPDIEEWHSTDVVTGKLTEEWKELRKNAFPIRRDHYLGY